MGTSIEYNDSMHKTRELINSFYQKCLKKFRETWI